MGLTRNPSREKYRLVVVMCLTDNLTKRKVVQKSHVPKYRVIRAKMQKYAIYTGLGHVYILYIGLV